MWVYVFGSLVRGEIDVDSDVDILAVVSEQSEKKNLPANFLKYTMSELIKSFEKGELFAHHLAHESQLIYSDDGRDIIELLGSPTPYSLALEHIIQFKEIGLSAIERIRKNTSATVFNYGLIYMALRDVAMILSYIQGDRPSFSKNSPYHVSPQLTLPKAKYSLLRRCRAASTRGVEIFALTDRLLIDDELSEIERWLKDSEEEVE